MKAHGLALPLLLAAALALIAGLYFFVPRRAHIREFEPAQVARLETAMWRDYYDHRYGRLLAALYELNRRQYGFSPWDSARLSYCAAFAAKRFQPTRSRAEAQRALPLLERYYSIIRRRAGERFDPRAAAGLELDWWQLRRESATADQYGEVVGKAFAEVYGVDNDGLRQAALLHARMMAYRDERRDGRMRADDWRFIETNLTRAYELLRAAVAR